MLVNTKSNGQSPAWNGGVRKRPKKIRKRNFLLISFFTVETPSGPIIGLKIFSKTKRIHKKDLIFI